MLFRPVANGSAFEHVVLSALRVRQLIAGCVPRVAAGHKHTTTAQLEVAAGKVTKLPMPVVP